MLKNSNLLVVLAGAIFVACTGNEFKCTESGLHPLPLSDCKSYYLCSTVNGIDFVATKHTCDDGLLFDETQEKCVPQNAYECLDANADIIDPCQNQTGRFPIPNTNCSSYYFCMKKGNGTVWAIYSCPIGSKFSTLSRRCERAYQCREADVTTTTSGSTNTNDETTITVQSNGTTSAQEPSTTMISTASGGGIITTVVPAEETTITTSAPSEVTIQESSSTVAQSRPPLVSDSPPESTITKENSTNETSTTENSTPEASFTTTSENTIIWQTSEITSAIPVQTASQNGVTTTELPQTSTIVPSTETPSPIQGSTVSTETIVGIPIARPNSLNCAAKCIMSTKTGNYRIDEDTTSYVSCIRLDAMLFCGINKCDSGKVFCETSYRCIDRI